MSWSCFCVFYLVVTYSITTVTSMNSGKFEPLHTEPFLRWVHILAFWICSFLFCNVVLVYFVFFSISVWTMLFFTQTHQRFAQCARLLLCPTINTVKHTTFFWSCVVGLLVMGVRCNTHTQAQTQVHTHRQHTRQRTTVNEELVSPVFCKTHFCSFVWFSK